MGVGVRVVSVVVLVAVVMVAVVVMAVVVAVVVVVAVITVATSFMVLVVLLVLMLVYSRWWDTRNAVQAADIDGALQMQLFVGIILRAQDTIEQKAMTTSSSIIHHQSPTSIAHTPHVSHSFTQIMCVCVFFTLNRSSTRRHPAHPVSVLIVNIMVKTAGIVTYANRPHMLISKVRIHFFFTAHNSDPTSKL